jgi:hypothetical protein
VDNSVNGVAGNLLSNDGAIASIQVVATIEGRFDSRLAATGSELFSATDLVLTTWDASSEVPTVTSEVRADDPRPGPLVAEGGRVVWGAALIGSAVRTNDQQVRAAVPELGEAAPRHFRLRFGAASLDGRQVLLYVERVEPRAKAGRLPEPPGPRARWVIADAGLTTVAFSRDEPITTARWEGSAALVSTSVVGRLSSFILWSPDGARTLTMEDGTVARSLVPMGDGRWAAGMASGHVATFAEGGTETNVAAHSRPVTALAYDRGSSSLASGGEDGRILVRRPSGPDCDLDAGQPVEALTWAGEGALVAKVGGADGQLLVMRIR